MEHKHYFEAIRVKFCSNYKDVTVGKMMRSEAIHYKGKVFAFFSTKQKMVFKLGKGFNVKTIDVPLEMFSPFKNKKPMSGWYQLGAEYKDSWESLTSLALDIINQDT
ncbi:hypothetical protein [Flavivirga rizhaonensis]|uniref:TfoX N-terminal domain-containing protein n=1 Tax=Flavivirga rizhaonensis TaxID=2559571 RepID=A0A4S1DV97_9FLAO|nr:hypothetical protein [Flavivirga rizhaonensis]TGV02016.1 hypothetical protein EM932_12595 [Flavivirga rizhaonensis]